MADELAFLLVVAVLAVLAGVVWLADFCQNCHPLERMEIGALAEQRRRDRAIAKFSFSSMEQPADPYEKKAMKSEGQFVSCNLEFYDAPARIAGLLK